MYKKIFWIIILIFSILLTIVFAAGSITAINITTDNNTSDANTEITTPQDTVPEDDSYTHDPSAYNILVLGDSIAVGSGDETGVGFTSGLKETLEKSKNKTVNINNLAVNGATSSDLLQVTHQKEISLAIKTADMVMISIGGNEIKFLKEMNPTNLSNNFEEMKKAYTTSLDNILKAIRSENSTCSIVFIGLYNPFADDISPEKLRLLNTWNYETKQLLSYDPNSTFIPTYDLFVYNLDEYLAPDNFHPNAKGYKAISDRLVQVLRNL